MVRRKLDAPKGLLRTTGSAPRRYRHVRYHPSPDREPCVEHYWTVQWDLRGQDPERGEVLPHPSMQLIFEGGGKSRVGLHEVFGTDSDGLEASILSESDDLSRIEIIERFLRARRPAPAMYARAARRE